MEQCQQFPSFLGIGTQKGGTTTLYRLLLQHPQVYLPIAKELHYFSLHYALGESWYRDQFAAAAPGQHCGEITPYYLFHPEAPKRIAGLLPAVKLVLLLRDPVERTLSQVFHSRRLGLEPLVPEAALAAETERLQGAEARLMAVNGRDRSHQEHSYLARSRYEQQLARYLEHFPSSQLLILRSEDLFSQPETSWFQLQMFLELEPQTLPSLPCANAGAAEAAGVSVALRQQLRADLAHTYQVMEARYGLVWP